MGLLKSTSMSGLFKTLEISNNKDIYRFYCSIHMYRIIRENSNSFISDAVPIAYPQHYHNTRNRNLIVTPFPRVDAIRFNFQYQFISVWNEIPTNIQEAGSLRSFKFLLRESFLRKYWNTEFIIFSVLQFGFY